MPSMLCDSRGRLTRDRTSSKLQGEFACVGPLCIPTSDGSSPAGRPRLQRSIRISRIQEQQMTTADTSNISQKPTSYYPWWLDNLAEDVTGEGAAMQGVLHGAECVHRLVTDARKI